MWEYLKSEQKEKYRTLITNFASLSSAFSQKSDTDDETVQVAPIINSKFQETVFQRAFNARAEDIANTSFDASVVVDDSHKYLVGIKSFGINSGDQKVAQFKKDSQAWTDILQTIQFNASISATKDKADDLNHDYYQQLAREISLLRNQRIASSKAQIKGFKSTSKSVESVYHVLMPTSKGQDPEIFVGETSYLPIDLERLEILGATSLNNPTNFRFTDGNHTYKYTAADSQLHMTFDNKNIIVDQWSVQYIEDPFYIFEHLHQLANDTQLDNVLQTVSWVMTDKTGNVETYSGFNAFNGASKLAKKDRLPRIQRLREEFSEIVSEADLQYIVTQLELILLNNWSSRLEKEKMAKIRHQLMDYVSSLNQDRLQDKIEKLIFRPVGELYIPLPDSARFHYDNPDFFGKGIGTFEDGSKKLRLPKESRTFKLKFLSSGDVIDAYINQEAGKAIQSVDKQDILGEWLLRGVFQLKEREILTGQKLIDLGINGIRLSQLKTGEIGIDFIWIDVNNPPRDAIGWVAKR